MTTFFIYFKAQVIYFIFYASIPSFSVESSEVGQRLSSEGKSKNKTIWVFLWN